ncbi:hypothetical protein ACWCQK_08635 [Streptomyces sp. NPDC002306]
MQMSARIAAVLAGLALGVGGVALAAPAAQADIPACTSMVQKSGVDVSDVVTTACTRGVHRDLQACVSALTGVGVPGGAANGACRMAADPPR